MVSKIKSHRSSRNTGNVVYLSNNRVQQTLHQAEQDRGRHTKMCECKQDKIQMTQNPIEFYQKIL